MPGLDGRDCMHVCNLRAGSRPSQEKEPGDQAIRERLLRGHRFLEDAAMKPGPFGYHHATSVSDAVRLLSCYLVTTRAIAAAQSLIPRLPLPPNTRRPL